MKHIKHVKYILPANRYINQLPDYSAFGRKTTLRMNPDHIPDLHWNLAKYVSYHKYRVYRYTKHSCNYSLHRCGSS